MRPRVLRTRLLLVGLGAVLAGMVVSMPAAKADPTVDYAFRNATSICALLDHDPNFTGVDELTRLLLGHGLTPTMAADVMILAVDNVCPEYAGLLVAWAKQIVQPSPVVRT